MVASTDIKFYVHTNNNAPQLQNAYGSMINVLDACLINGINIGTVSSLAASGTTVTALFSSAHNLMQYQVIKITGANQSEFNGEHRILTAPNAQSVTFKLAAAPSTTTATGTITASLPPLGWEKPFSSANANDGGKAAYRSANLLLSSRPFLRVVDELDPAYTATYAKYAKVGIVEDMTDINTMHGVQAPFDSASPDKNWVGSGSGDSVYNGWAKWHYARSTTFTTTSSNFESGVPAQGVRKWILIGNGDYFYIIPSCVPTAQSNSDYGLIYGFGYFDSLIKNDMSNTFLSATLNYITTTTGTAPATQTGLCNTGLNALVFKNYSQMNVCAKIKTIASINIADAYPGNTDYITSNGIVLSPAIFLEDSATPLVLRGQACGLSWFLQKEPHPELQIFVDDGEIFIAKKIAVSSGFTGQIAIKVGDA